MRTTQNGTVLRQRLIIQSSDTVMVSEGEIAFLHAPDSSQVGDWTHLLIMAMNFLNAGCPQVRIWSNYVDRQGPADELSLYSELNRVLDALAFNQFIAYRGLDGVTKVERKTKEM